MLDEKTHESGDKPLEYFDPMLDDELERALAEEPVSLIPSTPVASIPVEATIAEAVEKLGSMDVGCLVVVDGEHLVGIFTERDVLNRVVERYDRIKHQPISVVMTPSPNFAYAGDPAGGALTVMAANGYRHVPVVETSGRIVGIISPQRVAEFVMRHIET